VLLRLAYLTVTTTFAALRLLPASDRDKDTEILVLRHQIAVLERELGDKKVRFTPPDPGFVGGAAAPLEAGGVAPDAVAGTPGYGASLAPRPGQKRPRCPVHTQAAGSPGDCAFHPCLGAAPGPGEPRVGYRRVHGELLVLGVKVAASTVWEILKDAGIDPVPERASGTWVGFLRLQADALLACDFFERVTLCGARMYVLAVIEHRTRRIRVLGATGHRTAWWVAQAVRNLVMDLQDAGFRARYLVRDRDGKFPGLFDAVLADVGIKVVLTGVRMPRMNALMERWVQTCRRELLDRTLIRNQRSGTNATCCTPCVSSKTSVTNTGPTAA
jgi:hypothetical protein